MIETLDRRAMLAHLGISAWSARKYDRKAPQSHACPSGHLRLERTQVRPQGV